MTRYLEGSRAIRKAGKFPLVAIYLYIGAAIARTMISPEISSLRTRYLWLEAVFLFLSIAAWWLTRLPRWAMHLYFVIQCTLVVTLVSLYPKFDFVILLFIVLSLQASFLFSDRVRLSWVGSLVVLTWGSMMYFNGFQNSLWTTPTVIAAEIVILAYALVKQEVEEARDKSQALLRDLSAAHHQLELHAKQVEEVASDQERSRVARELHDTVSQLLFSISLTARSAELLVKQDYGRLPEQIERLKNMTAEASSQLRSLIGQLRPSRETIEGKSQ